MGNTSKSIISGCLPTSMLTRGEEKPVFLWNVFFVRHDINIFINSID